VKKVWLILMLLLVLTGCGAKKLEPMLDVYAPESLPEPAQVVLDLPQEAGMEGFAGEAGRLYLCEGYCIAVESLAGGDMNATLRQLTGYDAGNLTVLQRTDGGMQRYECAWTCVGEAGDQVGRAVVVDDGIYHYCVSVTAPAEKALKLQPVFRALFESFELEAV
jgi:hypothetical protein